MGKENEKRGQYAKEHGILNSSKGIAGPGRPKMTVEEKALKKVEREVAEKFREKLEKLALKTLGVYKAGLDIALKKRIMMDKFGNLNKVDPGAQEVMTGIRAADSINDRIFGTPKRQIEVTGKDDGPIEIADPRQVLIDRVNRIAQRTREVGDVEIIEPEGSGSDPV